MDKEIIKFLSEDSSIYEKILIRIFKNIFIKKYNKIRKSILNNIFECNWYFWMRFECNFKTNNKKQ